MSEMMTGCHRDNPRCSRDGLKAARSSFSTLPVQHVYTNKGYFDSEASPIKALGLCNRNYI